MHDLYKDQGHEDIPAALLLGELPTEITRDVALANMPGDAVLTDQTPQEYLDEMLSSGAINLIAIDSALV